MGVAVRFSGATLLLVGACAGGGPARVAPRAVARVVVGPPRVPAPACKETAALTAKARRQLAEGRALGALAHLDRIVHACATEKTRALERRVMALLEPPGHSQVAPRELFARAARERAAGHGRKARLLESRAAYALERRTGKSVVLEPWPDIEWARWSPDGRLVAVEASSFVSVLDAASGREVCRSKADTAKFSPDSRFLLTTEPTRLVDIASCRVRLDAGKDATGTFSPHSRYLYRERRHGVILDLATLKPVWHIAGDSSGVYRFSKSGRYFATVVSRGGHHLTSIIDLASGRIRQVKMAHVQDVGDVAFTPDERQVAIKTSSDSWSIEDLATGRVRKLSTRKCAGAGFGRSVVFSDSGRYVAIGGGVDRVCILDTRTRRVVRMFAIAPPSDGDYGYGEAFLGDHVVSIANGSHSAVYSLPSGRKILRGTYKLVTRSGNYLVFGGDIKLPHSNLYSATAVVARDGSARFPGVDWVVRANDPALTPWPDRGRVLLGARHFVVLDVAHARALGRHEMNSSAALGPFGKRVLSISDDRLGIWNARTGASETVLLGTVSPRAVAFDGPTSLRMLGDNATRYTISAAPRGGASASAAPGCFSTMSVDLAHGLAVGEDASDRLAVCRLGSGKILAHPPPAHTALPDSAYFSRDDRVLVSGNPASLWDFRKNMWTRLALGVQRGAAFGSGDLVAAGAKDAVHLVNVRSGKVERSVRLPDHDAAARPLYLDARADYLVTGDKWGAYGFDLGSNSRVKLGAKATTAAAINSRGVIALASRNAVVFRNKSDGKLLGTLRVAQTTGGARGPASALWQDSSGAIEITGDRTPWLALPCRIRSVDVPTGLCFDVLERSGVARRILEGSPPEGPARAGKSGGTGK